MNLNICSRLYGNGSVTIKFCLFMKIITKYIVLLNIIKPLILKLIISPACRNSIFQNIWWSHLCSRLTQLPNSGEATRGGGWDGLHPIASTPAICTCHVGIYGQAHPLPNYAQSSASTKSWELSNAPKSTDLNVIFQKLSGLTPYYKTLGLAPATHKPHSSSSNTHVNRIYKLRSFGLVMQWLQQLLLKIVKH